MTRRWLDPTRALADRVDAAVSALSTEDLIRLGLADFGPLARLDLPPLEYRDGPSGIRDAAAGTAFPATLALAATMDADLAQAYGAAIGAEARADGATVLLGPCVDLVRTPLAGRSPETFGEDPWLAGQLGAAHVRGVQSRGVIAMVKHLVGNTFERRRTGDGPATGRGDAIDYAIDPRTLHDTYLVPFHEALVHAGARAVMTAYNRVAGQYPAQSPALVNLLRYDWGWDGLVVPDFIFAVRDPAAALHAGLDIPGLDGPSGRTADMLRSLPDQRLRDIARRIITAIIGAGLADPTPAGPSNLDDHHALAVRVATESTVLLANSGVLPLPATASIAVIGPAQDDAIFVVSGSGSVRPDPDRLVTPLAGIRARASTPVTHAQGSHGDRPLPLVPAPLLTRPDGMGPGVLAEYYDGTTLVHRGVEATIDRTQPPPFVPAEWAARWSTLLTPRRSGRHRFTLTGGGDATLLLDGQVVAAGVHEAAHFIAGARYTRHATADLTAGVPVLVEVAYSIGPALDLPPLGMRPGVQLGWQEPDGLIDEAVAAAATHDVAVVIVQQVSGEGMDRATLALPGDQDTLVHEVASANPRTIVVVNAPGPVLMPWRHDVAAILQVWYPGQAFGDALAAVLFGDADPGGRLPVTFPVADGEGPVRDPRQYPGVDNVSHFDEGPLIGYRHYQATGERPLFPFGHGLSFGDFRYRRLEVTLDEQCLRHGRGGQHGHPGRDRDRTALRGPR